MLQRVLLQLEQKFPKTNISSWLDWLFKLSATAELNLCVYAEQI